MPVHLRALCEEISVARALSLTRLGDGFASLSAISAEAAMFVTRNGKRLSFFASVVLLSV